MIMKTLSMLVCFKTGFMPLSLGLLDGANTARRISLIALSERRSSVLGAMPEHVALK